MNSAEALPDRWDSMMREILVGNRFYRDKFAALGFNADHPPQLEDMADLPCTTKTELVLDADRHPPFGSNLTFPVATYVRLHQTSGTSGRPLPWLDTTESWAWWLDCWGVVYRAAGVTATDRVLVAFSFGPFVGFWGAFEAAQRLGALVIPGGGLSTTQRLDTMVTHEVTVLVCTPTYALRLAEVAGELGTNLRTGSVGIIVNAGEPGASVPAVRRRIEEAWGARCIDHVGATEVGAWAYGCDHPGHVHVNEEEFIAEVLPEGSTGGVTGAAGTGELVLTNLGRVGSPVVRYRTGDQVDLRAERCPCGRRSRYLRGGVLGRVDDMLVVRGVNIFPSAVENVIRETTAVEEFEVEVRDARSMAELTVRVETRAADRDGLATRLEGRLRERLGLRVAVQVVDPESLPRYELKARRFKFL